LTTPASQTQPAPSRGQLASPLPDFSRRNAALDGIRGFAFLCIFICHYVWFTPVTTFQFWASRIGHSLSGSLDIFFVLSGFLITGILLDSKGKAHYFRNFYMRRMLRILPLYYAVLLLCHGNFRWIYPYAEGNRLFVDKAPWYWFYLYNNHVAFNLKRFEWDQFTVHFWSLCVEEQFYLVWPFVVMLCSRRGLAGVCGALIVGCPLVRAWEVHHYPAAINMAYFSTFGRLDGLALGALLAVAVRTPAGFALSRRLARPLILAMLGAIVALFFWRQGFFDPDPVVLTAGLTVFSLFALGCVAVAATAPKALLTRFFELRLFTVLGKYSYGLYIWHNLARFSILTLADLAVRKVRLLQAFIDWGGHSPLRDSYVRTALALGLTMVFALISYHFFEKRFLALKVYFEYGDGQRGDAGGEKRAVPAEPAEEPALLEEVAK
jgi:peptidoglycan/LPS O-acetylase OafA/YrhL